jgi:hypothetical protein
VTVTCLLLLFAKNNLVGWKDFPLGIFPGGLLFTLFLHENVQTEAVSIQFEEIDANRGHFYSDSRH